ncbi:hypothetical protein D9757_004735 [Collybiopsis confluens]|uniref:Uncharacterized protein n=1 Tax=Collybiopsis confluens TaxID=2823264 RepID=A0A8H5HT15_9AGAR|nr:hypothetical protein D9757_004735 [Collybiopsis confluens]
MLVATRHVNKCWSTYTGRRQFHWFRHCVALPIFGALLDTMVSFQPSAKFALSEEISPDIAVASNAIQCMLYGVQLVLVIFTTYALGRAGLRSPAQAVLLFVTFITFATSTVYVVLSLRMEVLSLTPGEGVIATSWGLSPRELALEFVPIVNYVCSDIVLNWRAFVFWNQDRRILAIPIFLLGSSIITMFVSVGTANNPHIDMLARMEDSNRSLFAAWLLSFATNIAATTLMAIKTWQHRGFIRKHMEASNRSTFTSKVMILLVESGVIYCSFWACLIATNTSFATETPIPLNIRYTGSILQDASVQLSGIYPIIIIALVTMRKSVADVLMGPEISTFQAGTGPDFAFRSTATHGTVSANMQQRQKTGQSAMAIELEAEEGGELGRERKSRNLADVSDSSDNGSMV